MKKTVHEQLEELCSNMICAHCGSTFFGTMKQARRSRYEQRPTYCSPLCARAGGDEKRRKTLIEKGYKLRKGVLNKNPCPICKKRFESKIDKKYCSLACYNKSPDFLKMVKKNCAKGRLTSSRKWDEKMKRICPVCKKEFRADRSKRKFCGRLCYRKFHADLYDAWIANPQRIALPQCYDEFMLQNKLPCLIDGCQWSGSHLSIHLNQAHGIRAGDFKRAAGFNLTTGLVSPSLFKSLSERSISGVALREGPFPKKRTKGTTFTYISRERREHIVKGRLYAELKNTKPKRKCKGCGNIFTQSTVFGRALYCSQACRDLIYKETRQARSRQKPDIAGNAGARLTLK